MKDTLEVLREITKRFPPKLGRHSFTLINGELVLTLSTPNGFLPITLTPSDMKLTTKKLIEEITKLVKAK